MKVVTFEFMVYNYYLNFGILLNYEFENTNSGVLQLNYMQKTFLSEMYDFEILTSELKLMLIIMWAIGICLQFLYFLYKCVGIFCTFLHHRRNEF
jgi:uncharacterized membrane protein affecting hemolysin expression